eukprot:1154344-Pelagomonas_calceolata.AAC.2
MKYTGLRLLLDGLHLALKFNNEIQYPTTSQVYAQKHLQQLPRVLTHCLWDQHPCSTKVIYKRENEDFQLRFSFKFESAEEVFFAFAIPFSYRENQVCRGVTGALQKGGCSLHGAHWHYELDGARWHP